MKEPKNVKRTYLGKTQDGRRRYALDILADPTVDKQVAAGADDGRRYTGTDGFNATDDGHSVGYHTDAAYLNLHAFFRFTGVTISGTINVSYIQLYCIGGSGTDRVHKVYGVDEDNPAAPTSAAEFDADPLTTAGVDWDGSWTASAWNDSPSLNTIFQELVNSYAISNEAVMVQVKNDGATAINFNSFQTYEYGDHSRAAKLHIEYTEVVAAGRSRGHIIG